MTRHLLDTSIQIRRLIYYQWKENCLDYIWDIVTPVVSEYVLMEFKNSLINSIQFLIDLVEEIKDLSKEKREEDIVSIRLRDIIKQLSVTSKRISDRKIKLALAIAEQMLKEGHEYPRSQTPQEVIEILKFHAIDLESFWFYWYPRYGKPQIAQVINTTNCYIAEHKTPLNEDDDSYTCKKGQYKCNIISHCKNPSMESICELVKNKELKIRSTRLKKGIEKIYNNVLKKDNLDLNLSIGQKLCWPVGDAIIFSKARENNIGLMTSDFDQRVFSMHFAVKYIFLDGKWNLIKSA